MIVQVGTCMSDAYVFVTIIECETVMSENIFEKSFLLMEREWIYSVEGFEIDCMVV